MDDIPAPHPWHALSVAEVKHLLATSDEGLATHEAQRRLDTHGANRLPPPPRPSPWIRFLRQFHNILIYVLLAAAGLTAALGHWADMAVILAVILVNALIGFVQEGKAEKALEAIRGLLSQRATVLRGGRRLEIAAEALVPGDVVILQPGDKVPADLRLLHARELRIEEAALTGESVPVDKSPQPVMEDALLGDRGSMAFSSTLVTYGHGAGIVVGTGPHTEIGRINALLSQVEELTTPLLRQIDRFGRLLSGAIIVLAALTFAFGVLLRGYTTEEMFLAAVGLAVAAIPEGLPAIITVTLAIGVQAMAQRNAIIRRLPAVETLGSVSVICSDKTGTLTRNEMTVTSVATAERLFEVTGSGYDPHGGFSLQGKYIDAPSHPPLIELCRAAILCNDASLSEMQGRLHVHGDPTEAALVTVGMKAGLDPALVREEFPRTDSIPFESAHRFMATLHHDHAGHGFIILKGAPERVLEVCPRQRVNGEDETIDLPTWHARIEQMAKNGQRVLAIAFKAADNEAAELCFDDVAGGLTLLGIVGLIDPPREDAIAAVARCHEAGVRVTMITGDHAVTARAVGVQMGIGDGRSVLTGGDLDEMDDQTLQAAVATTDVFARASPENKLRLVQALQAEGRVVAMTGDGVNDAPALRRADVGVAMGINGTEVAKEAAEMVLTDDNFASISHAVEEGRRVYDNIKKSILFILPTNGGEAFTIVAAVLFGRVLPITPLQILWVNMITAVTLALSLAFEPAEAEVMRRPPRDPSEPLLSRFLVWRIIYVSAILVVGIFGLFSWERAHGVSVDQARTVAVNTLVLFEVFYLFNSRYIFESAFRRHTFLGNRYALLAVILVLFFQWLFTYVPFFQVLFGTTALDGLSWVRILMVAFSVFLLVEAEKGVLRYRRRRRRRHRG